MDKVDRSRNPRSRALGVIIAFFFGMNSAKCVNCKCVTIRN